jgi:hypothetical protein
MKEAPHVEVIYETKTVSMLVGGWGKEHYHFIDAQCSHRSFHCFHVATRVDTHSTNDSLDKGRGLNGGKSRLTVVAESVRSEVGPVGNNCKVLVAQNILTNGVPSTW